MKSEVFSFCRVASTGSFRMLVAIPAFFMLGSPALAVIVDNSTLDVDSTVPATDYLVRNNGVLNLTRASTQNLNVVSGSTLNINGATVNAEPGIEGISISDSRGTLVQANVTSDWIGMMVNRSFSSTQGSTVTATDSQFRGGEAGIQITALSHLTLIGSEVTGQAAGSVGLNMIGGEVHATDGTRISGERAGVRMVNDSSVSGSSNTLVLDGASVEGRNGPAIEVARGANVSIEVLNNSTLQGSADQLLVVQIPDGNDFIDRFLEDWRFQAPAAGVHVNVGAFGMAVGPVPHFIIDVVFDFPFQAIAGAENVFLFDADFDRLLLVGLVLGNEVRG